MTTPWTRLEGTEIWDAVKQQMADSRLKYHNFNHVLDLYRYANELMFEYDEALDYAILFHDYLYTHIGNNEFQSMLSLLMFGRSINLPLSILGKAVYLISTTKDHSFLAEDNRLVLLDLYGFASEQKINNAYDVLEECFLLYPDFSKEEIKESNKEFLENLYSNLKLEISKIEASNVEFRILDGIQDVLNFVHCFPDN